MQQRQLAWDSLSSFFRAAWTSGLAFLLVPWMIHYLGDESFALWSLAFSVLAIFGLLDAGLGVAAVKYVAEARGHRDREARDRALGAIWIGYLLLALIAVCGLWLSETWIIRLLRLPSHLHETAHLLLWVLGARAVFLALPLSLFRGILFGEKQITLLNTITIVVTTLYGTSLWWYLSHGGGIEGVAWLSLASMLVEHGLYLFFVWRRVPDCRFRCRGLSLKELREILSFSSYQLLINISSTVLLQMDLLLIKWFLPLSAVALYAVPLRIVTQAQGFVKQFVNVLSPYTSELHGARRDRGIRILFLRSSQWVMVPGTLIWVWTYSFGELFLNLWVGPAFAAAFPVLMILMTAAVVTLPCLVASNILTLTGGHSFTGWAAVAAVGVNLVVSVLLISSLGLAGVAIGTLIAGIVSNWGLVTRRLCNRLNLSLLDYLAIVLRPVVVPSLVMGAFGYSVTLHTFTDIFLFSGLGIAGYVTIYLYFFADWRVQRLVMGRP